MFQLQRNHPKQPSRWTTVQGSDRDTEEECRALIADMSGPFQYAVVPVPEPIPPSDP